MANSQQMIKKYNLCNLLIAIVLKHEPNTKQNRESFSKCLGHRVKEYENRTQDTDSWAIRKYLENESFLGPEREERFIKWINHELGRDLKLYSFNDPISIDVDFSKAIFECRKNLGLPLMESENPSDFGFYDIHVDRSWKYKSITSVDLDDDRKSLPNYLLYQSYNAALLWDEVSSNVQKYKLQNYCKKGLREIFETETWQNSINSRSVFFELGTGAPSKTNLILNELQAAKVNHHYVWIDASTPMLEHNVSQIDRTEFPSISFSAISANFEKIDDILFFLENDRKIRDFKKIRKCYFLLGFTLSNLNEARFIEKYSKACKKGDWLIFPIQFIPDEYSPQENKKNGI